MASENMSVGWVNESEAQLLIDGKPAYRLQGSVFEERRPRIDADRISACWSACAGIDDPAEAIRLAKEALMESERDYLREGLRVPSVVSAALAALGCGND